MANAFIVDSSGGISGSLTNLVDGTSYLVAGDGILITSQSNGSVVVASAVSPTGVSMLSASYTSSGTWVSPVTGIVFIQGCGGGGGGGGGYTASSQPGGGGGGGALESTVPVFVTSGSSYAIGIGAGGAGSNAGTPANKGLVGGDTTFGSLATFVGASGGGGGNNTSLVTIGGGLCSKQSGATSVTTATNKSLLNGYSLPDAGCVPSLAAGGWVHSSGGGQPGMMNCIGGFAGGAGTDSVTSGGGGGGAGPRGSGGAGASANGTGSSASANTGAGGGGGGGGTSAGAGGAGGSGYLTVIYLG